MQSKTAWAVSFYGIRLTCNSLCELGFVVQ